MRPECNYQPEEQGNPYARHSGGFSKSADDPCDGAACGVPKDARNSDQRRQGVAVIRLARRLRQEHPTEADIRREQQERYGADKPKPMKSARHPVHGGMLQFAASRCLFARPPARGDAVLALASFALVAWVVGRSIA